mgnify:CR=1 FL=1
MYSTYLQKSGILSFRCDFIIGIGQAITDDGDLCRGTDLLNVALDDDIAELFIQLDGMADTAGLFTGDKRAAGTTK